MNRFRRYVLDAEHRPVPIRSLLQWAEWFENIDNRTVGYTQINSQVTVSTIFLGLDHRYDERGPPLLFETMVFGGPLDHATWRYASWDDAEAGHQAAVRKARRRPGRG